MFFCFFYVIFPIERRNKKTRKYVWFKTYATASLVSETGPRSSYSDVSCRQKTSMVSYRCRGVARCPKAFSYCLTYSPTIWRRPTRIARGAFCARVQKMYFFPKEYSMCFSNASVRTCNGRARQRVGNERNLERTHLLRGPSAIGDRVLPECVVFGHLRRKQRSSWAGVTHRARVSGLYRHFR